MTTYALSRAAQGARQQFAAGLALVVAVALLPGARPATAAELPIGVTFDAGIGQVSPGPVKAYFPWVAVDSNNKAHVVYADGNGGVQYVNNVADAYSSPQPLERGIKENADPFLAIAVGPGNILHVVYADTGEANPQIYYQRGTLNGAAATWTTRERVPVSSAKAANPNLAVDAAGNVHVVWIDNDCGGNNKTVRYRVLYADGRRSGVSTPKARCEFQDRPQVAVTSDGKAHVAFQVEKEIYYARLEGTGWVNQDISEDPTTNSSNSSITTDGTALYVVWGEGIATDNHDVRFRRSLNGGLSWSNVIPISDTPDFAQFPNVNWSPNARRVYIAWSDRTGAADRQTEIYFREFDPVTALTTVAVRLTTQNAASDYPVASAGSQRLETVWQDRVGDNTFSVLSRGGQIKPFDPCFPDTDVKASVSATNANGQPATAARLPLDSGAQGASAGDPNYMRTLSFRLRVSSAGDCSGLKSARVAGGAEILIVQNNLDRVVGLPGPTTPGVRDVVVTVTDNVNNTANYTFKLVYDTASPTVASGSATDTTGANRIVRALTLSGVSVNDDLYGKVPGLTPELPDGRQFWGVWIANSRTPVADPTGPGGAGLVWSPVEVTNRGPQFTINWSLFVGLGYNPTDTNRDGDYYVYMRFLDGAGNPSAQVLPELKVTLAPGYTAPAARMPLVYRP